MDENDERIKVAENMTAKGGGFVQALGQALFKADLDNTARIKKAFPEYWERYLKN